MAPYLERWLTAPVKVRLCSWLAWTAAWLVIVWLALAPGRRENAALALHYEKLTASLAQQRKQLAGELNEAQRGAQIKALEATLAPLPFSALELVQAHGGRLVRWRPDGARGELVMDLEWAQAPSWFARLAQHDVRLLAFTLAPQDASLRLSLQMETHHEK